MTEPGIDQLLARPLLEADIDRATAALAAPLEEAARRRVRILAMRAGGEILAIPAREVAKVVPAGRIHRVPHRTGKVFRGIANHDGELLLCVSVEESLGIAAPAERARGVLVVAEQRRERWAFEVDAIVGVTDVDEASLRAPPLTLAAARSGCAASLVRIEEGEAVLLDTHALFAIFRGSLG